MKISYLLLCAIKTPNTDKIIKNYHFPSCKNCVFYKPNTSSSFTSTLSKCEKFGEKNIVTDEITYDYADNCRIEESKCGKEGIYFEEEKNVGIKVFKHKMILNLPYSLPIMLLVINLIIKVLK
jgi:Pyruvate/2-oxoacid:ferredoxin oxidoreductase delta subunit